MSTPERQDRSDTTDRSDAADRLDGKPHLAPQVAAVDAAREKFVSDIDVLDQEVRLEVLFRMETIAWRAVAGIAAAAAGLAAVKTLNLVWARLTPGSPPPYDPTDPETSTRDALVWTALTGVGVGVATVLAQRTAVKGWTQATGKIPPSFEKSRAKAAAKGRR